jgi:hypothetical protein
LNRSARYNSLFRITTKLLFGILLTVCLYTVSTSNNSAHAEIISYACAAAEDPRLTFGVTVDTAASTIIDTWTPECQPCDFCKTCTAAAAKLKVTVTSRYFEYGNIRLDRVTGQRSYLDSASKKWKVDATCTREKGAIKRWSQDYLSGRCLYGCVEGKKV